ncbi:hypothetical protein PRIPAC_96206 [Pristionchus pacificus]|uniref:Tumor protein p53-inducible protein 11 n=1 Tax=Pristionchus pacificus TaxID=54126 RepID=A0A2A6CH80_PRIPA|nr:hypothetical protein PRIPAC_96206 [Pristionchus pacificus]|eukprot:PDM77447.1 hypothetical protein PRIPAC_33177 [Pristionchus pacificus]
MVIIAQCERVYRTIDDDQRRLLGRKESASDLQSRLKTRKLLGVGESNGTVYKSKASSLLTWAILVGLPKLTDEDSPNWGWKRTGVRVDRPSRAQEWRMENGEWIMISQLLGINESLCQSFPRGLCYWETANTLYFFISGFLCILLPRVGAFIDIGISSATPEFCAAIRFYGLAVLSFAALLRCIQSKTENREDVAAILLILSFMTIGQIVVFFFINGLSSFVHLFIRFALLGGHMSYHYCLDPDVRILRALTHALTDFVDRLSTTLPSPPPSMVSSTTSSISADDKDK